MTSAVARVDARETIRQLGELGRSFRRVTDGVVAAGVFAAEKAANGTALWRDRSGKTRASIVAEPVGAYGGKVTARGAAHYLELGTGPHVIRGNPFLRFEVGGVVFFRRSVHHPGTSPRPFMAEAALVGERAMRFEAERLLAEFSRSAR